MRSTKLKSRISLPLLLATAALLFFSAVGAGTAFAACSEPFNCFAGADGDQATGPGDLTDWQDLTNVAVADDPAKGADTKFSGGDKETEPGGWTFITGNNTPKTDILEGWSHLESHFLDVAFVRAKQEGDTFLAFELNQKPALPRPGTTEPLYPQRSTGDILFTYDIATTNDLSFGICTWSGDSNSGDWLKLDGTPLGGSVKQCTKLTSTGTPPIAEGAVNWGKSIKGYLDGFDPIAAGKFGEAAVDFGTDSHLTDFLKGAMTNPCSPNGWFWMHSRASQSVLSQPKDVLTGNPLTEPTCGLTIDKKVSSSGAPGTFVDSDEANPLAAEVGTTVTYSMTLTNTGTQDLTVNLTDARCDSGTLSGPDGRDGTGDPLAAGQSVTYTCTHLITANDPDPLKNTACTTGTATLGSNSVTLGLDPTICDSAVVDVFQPGQLAGATGTKFQDNDGNGHQDPGDGPLAGFVFYVDYNGNGSLDAGEPAGASQANGTWSISGIKPGNYAVRESANPNYNCTAPANCKYDVTFTAGVVTPVGAFGNQPKPTSAVSPTTTPSQTVLGNRTVAPGRARLLGPAGCTARVFHARVRGVRIARVVFSIDGKKIKTVTRKNYRGTYAIRIDPRQLRVGVHRLIARVTFTRGSATKAKTYRLSFQRCPRALRAPRFTG
jgi:hypothetical protein